MADKKKKNNTDDSEKVEAPASEESTTKIDKPKSKDLSMAQYLVNSRQAQGKGSAAKAGFKVWCYARNRHYAYKEEWDKLWEEYLGSPQQT